MNIREVKKLTPLQRMNYLITERESIRLQKEQGDKRPWTDDEILGTYRFCNVRRMDDRVSRWLTDNWYTPNKREHPNILIAVCLARFFNLPFTLGGIGFPYVWEPLTVANTIRHWHKSGNNVFNAAYIVRGKDGEDKIDSVINYYIDPLHRSNAQQELDTSSMEKTAKYIQTFHGFGSFMAGQIVADLRWAMKGEWKDRNDWAPVGPGSSRGLRWLHDELDDIDTVHKPKLFVSRLQDMMTKLRHTLQFSISSRLEAHDYQSCLCEYDKYSSTLMKMGKPKQKYKPCREV